MKLSRHLKVGRHPERSEVQDDGAANTATLSLHKNKKHAIIALMKIFYPDHCVLITANHSKTVVVVVNVVG